MGLLLQTQGYDVVTTNSSVEGVKLAAESNPHIILLDLMMPELDGYQVCKAIRKFSNVPILVLSAVGDPSMIASALDSGADRFLSKPVPTSVLIAHIKKMARRQTGSLVNTNRIPKVESASIRRNTHPLAS
jgi:two-component system KDP operon response regulator KdpE